MAMDALGRDGLVVVARDSATTVRGFLHFVPTHGRPALSLSFMRRDRATPNGLIEFLVVRAIELLRERGVEELSLNFVSSDGCSNGRSCDESSGSAAAGSRSRTSTVSARSSRRGGSRVTSSSTAS